MIWLVLAGLMVLAGLAFLGLGVGFRVLLEVSIFTFVLTALALVLAVLIMQGSYELGWCEAQECRVW